MSNDDAANAARAVDGAEREPILGHRIAPARAAIDAAAILLDRVDDGDLRARLMLRLALVKMVETDWEGADGALDAAADHATTAPLKLLAAIRACRVAVRRNQRDLARQTLIAASGKLPDLDDGSVPWRDVTIEVALAIAEVAIHDDPPDRRAFDPLRELIDELAGDPRHADSLFTGRQLLATFAMSIGDATQAAHALRALVKLAAEAKSPADEVEARLALAGVLVDAGTPIGAEEAARVVQIARDRALEHGLTELHHAALIAQAGSLAEAGKTAGAIDRVLELARAAAAEGNGTQFVAAVGIMAELYSRSGDHVSAFRTIAESNHALSAATKSDTAPLFRPQLVRLRDQVGEERFAKIVADVDRANRLASEIAAKKPSDPS
ncbi:MAG: hypothetical protein IPQ07_04685 [Myxococcales bacterium]|nr:hypothetical protein [Myxococcales bacterium]